MFASGPSGRLIKFNRSFFIGLTVDQYMAMGEGGPEIQLRLLIDEWTHLGPIISILNQRLSLGLLVCAGEGNG